MPFPTNDKYWVDTKNFLENHIDKSDEILGPGEFSEIFPKVHYYISTTINKPKKSFFRNTDIKWAVIHKGLIPYIDFFILKKMTSEFVPVFANEVFVVFSKGKKLPLVDSTSPHLISFYEKIKEAYPPFFLKIKKIFKNLLSNSMEVYKQNGYETLGDLVLSKDHYLWIRRESSSYNSMNQDEIGINFDHEKETLKSLSKLSGKNKIFIDIGAHVGFFSIRLANKFKKVHAIEPNPSNLEALKINTILNKTKNITIYNKGCWNQAKQDTLYDRGGGSFLKNGMSRTTEDKEFVVDLITLDSIASNIEEPMVIKIDAEGAELAILQGADQTLKKNNVAWLIEHHEWVYHDLKNRRQVIIDLMDKYGYELIKNLQDNSKILFVKR